MKENTYDKIRLKILIAICIGVVLTTIIGIFISRSVVQHFDEKQIVQLMSMSQTLYQQSLEDDTATLSGVISVLRRNRSLQDLFLAGNRDALFAQSQDIFTELRDNYKITHFYYHTITGQNFLRVHAPNRHGDQIGRFTMQKAMTSGKQASGIELGPLGTFTLRVVVPWLQDGKVIGYLELGEEIEHITTKIAKLMSVDLVLLLHKENTSEQEWLRGQQLIGRNADWNLFKTHVLLNNSFSKIPPCVNSYLQTILNTEDVKAAGVFQVSPTLLATSVSLKDVGGNELGNFIILLNISESILDLRKASTQYLIYSFILLIFLMLGYWAYLGRIEKSISIGKEKLSLSLTEQKKDRDKLANILSSMAEGFIITMPSGKKITLVNTKMLEMLALPEEHVLGRPISDFISAETLPVAKKMIAKLNQGQQARGELMLVSSKQQQITTLITASPMFDERGEVIGSFSTWNDISDYKNTLNRLLETEENFNKVFYNTKDAIALIKNAQFTSCNEAFVKMLGASNKTEVLNLNPGALSPEQQPDGQLSQDKAMTMIGIAIEQGFHRFEWRHRKVTGEIFPVEVSLTAMQNDGELELHCLWQDICKQKQYEQNLKQAATDAQNASHSKDEFLANMSHEIRTPMSGIIGLTQLTLATELTKKQRQMLENSLYSAENLLGLLNDILDFSKIEAGQLAIESHDFSLEAMLDHLISTLSFQAQEKQLSLKNITDDKTLPQFIKTDELRLRQIIINLIGNGIKFTQTGGVSIKAEVDEQAGDNYILHFAIKDSGIGIPPEKRDAVFNSFTQADTSTSRIFGGTGLGLSITKQLVELMGGKIWLKSEDNQGATFHFTIKVKCGHAEKISDTPSDNTLPLKALKILLVEDNKINQDIARTVFETHGHQVTVAEHGMKALEILLEESFDVIFMDVQMPVLDGLTTTTIIRNCEAKRASDNDEIAAIEDKLIMKLAGKQTPIIAMTANAMSGDRQRCLDAGMNEYLTKPFMPEQINNVLHLLFQATVAPQAEDNEQKTTANTPDGKPMESLPEQVVNHLKSVYGMDDETAKKMLHGAMSSLESTLVEMANALEAKEYPDLHKATHSIKGALLNMGLKQLSEQAAAIESAAKNGAHHKEDCTVFIAAIRSFIADTQEQS